MSTSVENFLEKFGVETNSMKHHGVKGMKWGVRKRRPSSTRPSKVSSAKPSNTFRTRPDNRRMTDAELRNKLNRLQMEKQYKDLTSSPKDQSFVKKLLVEQGQSAARQIATRAVSVGIQLAVENAAGKSSGDTKKFLDAMAAAGKKKNK